MKKNLLCMALALVMATGMLAGCGGNDGDVSSADNGSTRVWKFSHTRAEGTDNDIMANKFADSLTGAIDGLKRCSSCWALCQMALTLRCQSRLPLIW